MKTIMTDRATNGMFLLNKQALLKNETVFQMESQSPIIESIIESIVEPIIYKC